MASTSIRAALAADPDVGAGNVLHKLIEHGADWTGPASPSTSPSTASPPGRASPSANCGSGPRPGRRGCTRTASPAATRSRST